MEYDYGFDMPDTRYVFITPDGERVTVNIVRHWYKPDPSEELNFQVSFNIECKTEVTPLPIGTTQEQAMEIAHILYSEDKEATKQEQETEAMVQAEIRMGA